MEASSKASLISLKLYSSLIFSKVLSSSSFEFKYLSSNIFSASVPSMRANTSPNSIFGGSGSSKIFSSISFRSLLLGFSSLTNSCACEPKMLFPGPDGWEKLNNGCCWKKGVWYDGGGGRGGIRNVDGGGGCNGGCGGWGGGGTKNDEGGSGDGGGERLLLLSLSNGSFLSIRFSSPFLSL